MLPAERWIRRRCRPCSGRVSTSSTPDRFRPSRCNRPPRTGAPERFLFTRTVDLPVEAMNLAEMTRPLVPEHLSCRSGRLWRPRRGTGRCGRARSARPGRFLCDRRERAARSGSRGGDALERSTGRIPRCGSCWSASAGAGGPAAHRRSRPGPGAGYSRIFGCAAREAGRTDAR